MITYLNSLQFQRREPLEVLFFLFLKLNSMRCFLCTKSKTKILNGRIILIVLAIIFFTIVIPFIINLCFKFNSPIKILSAEWDAGDFLSYYGTLLFGCIAAYLTYSANNINKNY